MRHLGVLLALGLMAVPPPITAEADNPAPRVSLLPGEYLWLPELAPQGPMLILISLPEQVAYVYRNGVRIGLSTVSSGKPGYETPTGIFSILQKKRTHFSDLYDDAPMPFMQRLTWDGVALHAGRVPGYPASHGCVRLPAAFAEKLFAATQRGITVVIADAASQPPTLAAPGLLSPLDPRTGQPAASPGPSEDSSYDWQLQRAPEGPVTVLVSSRDRVVLVLRAGIEVGRSPVFLSDPVWQGLHAYVLLETVGAPSQPLMPRRPALQWLQIPLLASDAQAPSHSDKASDWLLAGSWVPPGFAERVYSLLAPGATLILTDEPLPSEADRKGLTVLRADPSPAPEPLPQPPSPPPPP